MNCQYCGEGDDGDHGSCMLEATTRKKNPDSVKMKVGPLNSPDFFTEENSVSDCIRLEQMAERRFREGDNDSHAILIMAISMIRKHDKISRLKHLVMVLKDEDYALRAAQK